MKSKWKIFVWIGSALVGIALIVAIAAVCFWYGFWYGVPYGMSVGMKAQEHLFAICAKADRLVIRDGKLYMINDAGIWLAAKTTEENK